MPDIFYQDTAAERVAQASGGRAFLPTRGNVAVVVASESGLYVVFRVRPWPMWRHGAGRSAGESRSLGSHALQHVQHAYTWQVGKQQRLCGLAEASPVLLDCPLGGGRDFQRKID